MKNHYLHREGRSSRTGTYAVRFAAILLLLLFGGLSGAHAQNLGDMGNMGGRLFYIALPDTVGNSYDTRFPHLLLGSRSYTLMVYSPVTQDIRIGRANGASAIYTVQGRRMLEFNMAEISLPLTTVVNNPQTNVLKLEAEYPVIVYGFMGNAFGAGAFTAIPVEGWGKEYYAAAWPGEIVRDVSPGGEFNYRTEPKEAPAEILIVAAYDNTQVTIQPNGTLRECSGCGTFSLNAGESYLVQSVVDIDPNSSSLTQPDLGGSRIRSNKPIGVLSGNTRVMHNSGQRQSLGENSFKDLVVEWLSPVEQYGTEFVFLPTWDDRRQREGLEIEEARDAELVRIFAADGARTEVHWIDELGNAISAAKTPLQGTEFTEEKIGKPVPRVYHSSRPAQAVMSPNAVVKFNGTTTWGANYVGASYGAWSTYMVELVPRERWTSFAPIRTPTWPPTGMSHYLNIVTDSTSANLGKIRMRQEGANTTQDINFNLGVVPGTDLVWTSISLPTGVMYTIEGMDGAKFSGFVYGAYKGNEQYRPGGTKRDDGKGSGNPSGGNDSDPHVLHPSEYEEDISLYYGYPLPSARCELGDPDDYDIKVSNPGCGEMIIDIEALNDNPVGIRSIALEIDSSDNVRLEYINPTSPPGVSGDAPTEATVRVVPLNPKRYAAGIVVIRDRSCNSRRWRVEYRYDATSLDVSPANLVDFGKVTLNTPAGEKRVVVTNPGTKPITIYNVDFAFGNQEYTIERTNPSFDWTSGTDSLVLEPGEELEIWVNITPREENRVYIDSLVVDGGCVQASVELRTGTAVACLTISDIDFGSIGIGVRKSSFMELCNQGEGRITFVDPFLTWFSSEFEVSPLELQKLANTSLGPGECISIEVSYQSEIPGEAITTARVWSSTNDCDTGSVWRALVVDTTVGVTAGAALRGYAVTGVSPNPAEERSTVSFMLGRTGQTVVEVYNTDGRRIETLLEGRLESGEHQVEWNASNQPGGRYYFRIRSGEWSATAHVVIVK